MDKWKKIVSQEDIDELLRAYGGFHDSCIVSLNYRSGPFVDKESAMHFGSSTDRELRVVFHRQWEPKALELCFIGLRQLHLTGWQENYMCDIFDAYLAFHDGLLPGEPGRVIVWADGCGFDINRLDSTVCEPAYTYIVSNMLKWRIADGSD